MGYGKKTTVEKTQPQGQGNPGSAGYGKIKKCNICFGPHLPHKCKWTPGAYFTCGQVRHRISNCPNLTMKNVFCFGCRQRGHVFSECKE